MLYAALNHHLASNLSPVSEDIQANLYVDNVISGCHSEEAAIQYYNSARTIMAKAKFNLRSWASNSTELQTTAKQDGVAESGHIVKILGLQWNIHSDTLFLASRNISTNTPFITKRDVLQDSSRIFDPLGFISPVIIQAKIFIQELWGQQIHCDEPLNDDLRTKWIAIAKNVQNATAKFSIPRHYSGLDQSTPVTIHIFADTSTKAYGAIAYSLQDNQVSFIMSKTRVAPLKHLTLPRLELSAALLASRLANFILKSLQFQVKLHLWSDSQIVLHWITSTKKLQSFVSNRVEEITTLFPATSWHFCPTTENPADLLTRGISSQQLISSNLWKSGPQWLASPQQWPIWPATDIQAATLAVEADTSVSESTTIQTNGLCQLVNIDKYSNLTKLFSVTAFVLRFTRNCRNPNITFTGPITPAELTQAHLMWIRECQQEIFDKEISNLQAQSKSNSPNWLPLVRQLRLFLDKSVLLRCGGRIHNAPTTELAKFPYLLPGKHSLTRLIIHTTHEKQLHGGVNSMLTALRQRYWIPSARQVTRRLLQQCVVCKKVNGKPYQVPDPPPLVKERMQNTQPFEFTGVDFTGALYVRNQGGESKIYVCLFTGAVSRAVHLEIVTDLTVETFLQAFRRFSSHKSLPRLLISDNASTYMSAAEELQQLFNSSLLTENIHRKGVMWRFIPKRAPWYGGFWERLIGLTKTALKKVLGRTFATLSSLQTLIVEVEAILNDHPLTYVSPDERDPEPLTPAHLLYGRRIASLPHPMVEDDELDDPSYGTESDLKKRANTQALILKHFWKRWKLEYLTSLREFHKTTGNNIQKVQIGDVVLVHDDTPRIRWNLAVIEDIIKGSDGLIRTAKF